MITKLLSRKCYLNALNLLLKGWVGWLRTVATQTSWQTSNNFQQNSLNITDFFNNFIAKSKTLTG